MTSEQNKKLQELCIQRGLCYTGSPLPVLVSPGVYMFYAVPMTYSCGKHGHCRQQSFYVVLKGDTLYITP